MSKYPQVFYLVNNGTIEDTSHSEQFLRDKIKTKCKYEQGKCEIKTIIKRYNPNFSKIKLPNIHPIGNKSPGIPKQDNHYPLEKKCPYCLNDFETSNARQVTCGKQKCMHLHQIFLETEWHKKHENYKRTWDLKHTKYFTETNPMPLGMGLK